jgi:hypothetical protein
MIARLFKQPWFIRVAGLTSSCVLLAMSLQCANLTSYNWWAAGFKNNQNAEEYQKVGDWYFTGSVVFFFVSAGTFIGSLYFARRAARKERIEPDMPTNNIRDTKKN